jgi:hypothetical protein
MMSELTYDEKVALVTRVTLELAKFTHPFLSRVVGGIAAPQGGRALGSGVRVSAGGNPFLLTAASVVDAARSEQSVAFGGRDDGSPWVLESLDAVRVLPGTDVAALPLADHGGPCWPLPGTAEDEWALSEDFLFLHGYPLDPSTPNVGPGDISTTSFPFGSMRREDDLPDGMEPSQIAIDFDLANLRSSNGRTLEWMDPRQLFGAPLWRAGLARADAETWEPGRAQLVGIITQWRPEERLLIASRLFTGEGTLGLG